MRGGAVLGAGVIRCYVTDRKSCPRDLLENIGHNVRDGVEFIQIREKDLSARELFELTRRAVGIARGSGTQDPCERPDGCGARRRRAWGASAESGNCAGCVAIHCSRGILIGVSATRTRTSSAPRVPTLRCTALCSRVPGKVTESGWKPCAGSAGLTGPRARSGRGHLEECGDSVGAGAAGIAGIRLFQGLQDPTGSAR